MRLESSEVQNPLVKVTKERNFCKKGSKITLSQCPLGALVALAAPWVPPGSLLGASWEPPGSLLGASWESLVPLGSLFEASLVVLGAFWVPPGDIER